MKRATTSSNKHEIECSLKGANNEINDELMF